MSKDLISSFFDLGIMESKSPTSSGRRIVVLQRVSSSRSFHVDASWGFGRRPETLVNNAIIRWGNADQKSKYCRCWPRTPSAPMPLRGRKRFGRLRVATKAEDKGDYWVLNGQKLWITNA